MNGAHRAAYCAQQTGVHRIDGLEVTILFLSYLGGTSDLSTQCLSRCWGGRLVKYSDKNWPQKDTILKSDRI